MEALEYHFLFVDIVGLTQPNATTEDQVKKITVLNKLISECDTFKSANKERLFILPTGDGAAIGFPDNMNKPLDLAIEIHKKLRQFNLGCDPSSKIQLTSGIHSAPIVKVKDLKGEDNAWGEGIILARRIMDAGQADHILLSDYVGQNLAKLSNKYRKILYHAGYLEFKHGRKEFVWYAYDNEFGNNNTSTIENLNKKDVSFNAEILDKRKFRLGETFITHVYFKGKLVGGFFDNMIRAPIGKIFPFGGSNWWLVDPHTTPIQPNGPGQLVGEVEKESSWGCTIPPDFPTGEYTVYIRVYDHLETGHRPVIREKVETIEITN